MASAQAAADQGAAEGSGQQPSPQVDNTAYTYNADQQVTQIADTQGASGAPVEDQCFSYNPLSRLFQAWTSSNACATNPAGAGFAVGTWVAEHYLNNAINAWSGDVSGAVSTATHAVASAADDVAHAASSVVSTVASWF